MSSRAVVGYNVAMDPHTRIGCEAYIVREGKLLLGKRGKKAKGPWHGTWALPGGHLDFLERADEGIVREIQEELGIQVDPSDVERITVTDDLRLERSEHYIRLTFRVDIGDATPRRMEPEMREEWSWFALDDLPENIFPFHQKIFETLHTRRIYNSKRSR
jgi:8-oxo-dGTP diphosphatase